jgi:hypothetical protein
LASRPTVKRHPNGIRLADFFEEFSVLKQDQILELVAQLERMDVYRLKHTPAGATLMPIQVEPGWTYPGFVER